MQSTEMVYRRLGDIVVVVHLVTDGIYELNLSAARIWELAAAGRTAPEICDQLRGEFDECGTDVLANVLSAIASMRAEGLLDQNVHGR